MRRSSLVLALAALSSPLAFAAEELAPVEVTASRVPQPLSKRLADVSVISADDIAESGEPTLMGVLQKTHGLEINNNGGPQTATSTFIRGANSNQTLVLIDGQRFASATTGGASLNTLPLAQIERIEILRGPASSLYGADAIGGVINIITRKGEGPARLNLHTRMGRWQTIDTAVGGQGSHGPLTWSAQVQRESSDGYSTLKNPQHYGYNPDNDGYYRQSASARLGYEWQAGQQLDVSLLQSEQEAQYDASASYDDQTHQKMQALAIHSRNTINSLWTSSLRVGQTLDQSREDSAYPGDFKTRQQQLVWQHELQFNAQQRLTLGFDYLRERVQSSSYSSEAPDSRQTRAGVLVYQLQGRYLQAQLNARHDNNSQYGEQTTGGLTLGFSPQPAWRLSFGASTGFRAPSFNELYYPGYGRADIQPEHSRNVELGASYRQAGLDVHASAYRNRVRNQIEYQAVCALPGYDWGCAANIGRARLEGLSIGARQTGDLGWHVDLDWQNPRDEASGHLLARRAKRHAALGFDWRFADWSLGSELTATSRRYDDAANSKPLAGYGLVALSGAYRLAADWQLVARLENLLDRQYEIARDYATPGRNLSLTVQYRP